MPAPDRSAGMRRCHAPRPSALSRSHSARCDCPATRREAAGACRRREDTRRGEGPLPGAGVRLHRERPHQERDARAARVASGRHGARAGRRLGARARPHRRPCLGRARIRPRGGLLLPDGPGPRRHGLPRAERAHVLGRGAAGALDLGRDRGAAPVDERPRNQSGPEPRPVAVRRDRSVGGHRRGPAPDRREGELGRRLRRADARHLQGDGRRDKGHRRACQRPAGSQFDERPGRGRRGVHRDAGVSPQAPQRAGRRRLAGGVRP